MTVNFPATQRAIHAIIKREPAAIDFYTSRSKSLVNAFVYTFRIFSDPVCCIGLTVMSLLKAFYHSTKNKDLNKAKINALRSVDYILHGVCAPLFNFILIGKCLASTVYPNVCYRQATEKELKIISRFKKYQKEAHDLSVKGVKDLSNYRFETRVTEKMKQLKLVSEKTRLAYAKLKLYTI